MQPQRHQLPTKAQSQEAMRWGRYKKLLTGAGTVATARAQGASCVVSHPLLTCMRDNLDNFCPYKSVALSTCHVVPFCLGSPFLSFFFFSETNQKASVRKSKFLPLIPDFHGTCVVWNFFNHYQYKENITVSIPWVEFAPRVCPQYWDASVHPMGYRCFFSIRYLFIRTVFLSCGNQVSLYMRHKIMTD